MITGYSEFSCDSLVASVFKDATFFVARHGYDDSSSYGKQHRPDNLHNRTHERFW